jgi:hypothetical protein
LLGTGDVEDYYDCGNDDYAGYNHNSHDMAEIAFAVTFHGGTSTSSGERMAFIEV